MLLRAQGIDPDSLPGPARGVHLLEVYVFGLRVLRWERRASERSRVGEPAVLLPSIHFEALKPVPAPTDDPTILVP
jgi:hypothetical protein